MTKIEELEFLLDQIKKFSCSVDILQKERFIWKNYLHPLIHHESPKPSSNHFESDLIHSELNNTNTYQCSDYKRQLISRCVEFYRTLIFPSSEICLLRIADLYRYANIYEKSSEYYTSALKVSAVYGNAFFNYHLLLFAHGNLNAAFCFLVLSMKCKQTLSLDSFVKAFHKHFSDKEYLVKYYLSSIPKQSEYLKEIICLNLSLSGFPMRTLSAYDESIAKILTKKKCSSPKTPELPFGLQLIIFLAMENRLTNMDFIHFVLRAELAIAIKTDLFAALLHYYYDNFAQFTAFIIKLMGQIPRYSAVLPAGFSYKNQLEDEVLFFLFPNRDQSFWSEWILSDTKWEKYVNRQAEMNYSFWYVKLRDLIDNYKFIDRIKFSQSVTMEKSQPKSLTIDLNVISKNVQHFICIDSSSLLSMSISRLKKLASNDSLQILIPAAAFTELSTLSTIKLNQRSIPIFTYISENETKFIIITDDGISISFTKALAKRYPSQCCMDDLIVKSCYRFDFCKQTLFVTEDKLMIKKATALGLNVRSLKSILPFIR